MQRQWLWDIKKAIRKGEGMRISRSMWVVVGVVLVNLFCWAVVGNAAAAQKFAAKVNGVGIKALTLDAAVSNFIENQKMFGATVKDEDKGKLRKDILEELISAELLYQESQKAKLGDLAKEVDAQFENIKKGLGTEAEFQKTLKDRGIDVKDLKEDIKKGVYINAYLDKFVFKNIAVSEEEKQQEFEKNKDKLNVPETVKASHILIKFKEGASDEDKKNAKEKIEAVRQKALAGEDFVSLARENSEDSSAANGGDLGFFKRGEMVKPFEDAAFGLEKDQISPVVETQFGYHIIKVVDKKPARILSYEEVKEDIGRFLVNRHKRDAINKTVEGLKKTAKIERL